MPKHAGGRPLKFKTAKALQARIDEYWDDCYDRKAPYTFAGLASHLGMDRKTLWNYSQRDEFFPTIKKAKDKIRAFWEERLVEGKGGAGQIFVAKNYGYKDTIEQTIETRLDISKLIRNKEEHDKSEQPGNPIQE